MKKTALLPILYLLFLTACGKTQLNVIPRGLDLMHGAPIEMAFDYLGPPTHENTLSEKNIYSWIIWPQEATVFSPESRKSKTSYIGNHTFYDQRINTSWDCRVDIIVAKGIIINTQYQGTWEACQTFREPLLGLVGNKPKLHSKIIEGESIDLVHKNAQSDPLGDFERYRKTH